MTRQWYIMHEHQFTHRWLVNT